MPMPADRLSPFRLNVSKAVQAAGVILRAEPGHRMNYMKLLKVLYVAEREALKSTGAMITGDRVVAMERGPVLSGVYDLIKGAHTEVELWDEYIEKERYNVSLKGHPGVDKLSKFEIETLQGVAQRYEGHDEWDMVQITHEFEEWKLNNPGTSSKPIPMRQVLEAVGLGSEADAVLKEAAKQTAFDDFFARHRECGAATPS